MERIDLLTRNQQETNATVYMEAITAGLKMFDTVTYVREFSYPGYYSKCDSNEGDNESSAHNDCCLSANFSVLEEKILLSILKKHKPIVESKGVDAVTWKEKRICWEKIHKEFEKLSPTDRSIKNLKDKYENIKKKCRREKKVMPKCKQMDFLQDSSSSFPDPLNELDVSNFAKDDIEIHCNEIKEEEPNSSHSNINPETSQVSSIPADEKDESTTSSLASHLEKAREESLKSKKSKSTSKRKVLQNLNEELLKEQIKLFQNEDKRADEKHKLEIKELELKIELLKREIELKSLLTKS
uniref:Regulatory protein zeste n=1 Tax=Glossina palpalis gambiensis TaxID=67801 RepID=A0A1B0B8Y4_9MUSC